MLKMDGVLDLFFVRRALFLFNPVYFYSARSIAVENANNAGNVACYKPEAQAKGIE